MSPAPWQFLTLLVSGWISRRQRAVLDYLQEENRVLRQQLGERRLRLSDAQRRRLAIKANLLGRAALRELGTLVTPDTLLAWYRRLVAAKYDGSAMRRPGRPRTAHEVRALVVRIAVSNPTWGYTRIRGALRNVGIELARSTIARILAEHGLDPAPARGKHMPWRTFIEAHLGHIAAADFFTVEVLTLTGLVRHYVLFVIDLQSRRVHIAAIVRQPTAKSMAQIARNLTDAVDGLLRDARYLILDRDPLFTRQFRDILRAAGVSAVRLPARSPNLNAVAERFVLSIKSECLNKLIPLGERHLRHAVSQFVEHYHLERNHQGLDNRLIVEPASPSNDNGGPVHCRSRLGGLLSFYHRDAA